MCFFRSFHAGTWGKINCRSFVQPEEAAAKGEHQKHGWTNEKDRRTNTNTHARDAHTQTNSSCDDEARDVGKICLPLALLLLRSGDTNLFINSKLRTTDWGSPKHTAANLCPFRRGQTLLLASSPPAFPLFFSRFLHSVCFGRGVSAAAVVCCAVDQHFLDVPKAPKTRIFQLFSTRCPSTGPCPSISHSAVLFSMRTFWIIRNIFVLAPKTRHIFKKLWVNSVPAGGLVCWGEIRRREGRIFSFAASGHTKSART